MERRLNPRIPSQTRVKIYFNGSGRLNARLNDFSQGGVAITLDEYSYAPDINAIVFMLADNMDEPYPMKVVRCDNCEWVLRFLE